jgi:oligosaccharide repeat unit polymerase
MILPLALLLLVVLLAVHFIGQNRESSVRLSSNFWVVFYVLGYYLPIPLFLESSDGWSTIWGFAFHDKDSALTQAVALVTLGGLILSICSRGIGRVYSHSVKSRDQNTRPPLATSEVIAGLRIVFLFGGVFGVLLIGIQLVGGLLNLLANLGDRITLFAGLNAFFLPVNMLIGSCFAISASRAVNQSIPQKYEWLAVCATLPPLLLLGQKANIFILALGLIIIKLSTTRRVRFAPLVAAGLLGINLLLLYEFVFREAMIVGVDKDKLTLDGWFGFFWTQVTGNFMQIQNLTVLIDAMPNEMSYAMGETYIAIFSLVIPQQFISIKPLTAAGLNTVAFWPEVVARESTTMPPGIFGEAYMNFGWIGFILLCALIGFILRRIDAPWRAGRPYTAMDLVWIATAGALSLHFIRGELFAPLLIVIGIYIGAKLSLSERKVTLHRKELASGKL